MSDSISVPAIVLGSGNAGLAAAHALRSAGREPVILERAERTGASWRARYDDLRLNSVRSMSSLPGYRMERRYGAFPTAPAYADYLDRYATRRGFEIRHRTDARQIERHRDGWAVATDRGVLVSPVVVVATGHDHTPRIPAWPGRETFTGEILHSSAFRNAEPFVGRDVLVVGASNSGCEIAAHLARGSARSVRLSVRTGPLVLARRYLGIPLTYWSLPGRFAPDALLDLVGPGLQRWAFGDLTEFGLPASGSDRTLSAQRRSRYIPTVDGEFVRELKQGRVDVVAALESLDRGRVRLTDDTHLRLDAVIAATGYEAGLMPLVGGLNVLDEQTGLPTSACPVHAPGLFFIGYQFDLRAGLPYFKGQARTISTALRKAGTAAAERR